MYELTKTFNITPNKSVRAVTDSSISPMGPRAASIARTYRAIFNRVPDAAGLSYWIDTDLTVDEIRGYFLSSPEGLKKFGGLDNREFVNVVYENVLGRNASFDPEGWNYWTRLLEEKTLTQSEVVFYISNSEEFRKKYPYVNSDFYTHGKKYRIDQEIASGILYGKFRHDNSKMHVTLIDLEGGTEVLVSPGKSKDRVGTYAKQVKAIVSVNANWFGSGLGSKFFDGFSISKGHVLGNSNHAWTAILSFSRNGDQVTIEDHKHTSDYAPENAYQGVSGHPTLTFSGDNQINSLKTTDPMVLNRNPRTAMGISKDGRYLYLVTADGRQGSRSRGLTCKSLANFMLQIGADYSINFDGGGSTTHWLKGKIINRPSNWRGRARKVGNELVVKAGTWVK